ncbi:MAG TPA: amino acid adenylation domain-containing protein, partial [Herpetosiphonaceae bacterium]
MTTPSEFPKSSPPVPDEQNRADRCIHELIAPQAARTPEAIAVVCGADELSYHELDQQATALAHVLQAQGIGAEALVALCLPRAPDLVVALLAVLKAGAAYLPLDPAHPPARLATILADARPSLILSLATVAEQLPDLAIPMLNLDQPLPAAESRPLPAVDPQQLAYVIATSGSTGTPKGVQIQHRALAAHSQAIARHYALQPGDRVLQFASLSFDVAAEELFPTWLAGGTVVLFPQRDTVSLLEFSQEVALDRITVLNLPASYWHSWLVELKRAGAQLPPTLRLMIVGSEEVVPEALELWRASGGDRVLWANAYGTSETTITSTIYGPTSAPAAHGPVPIGAPIAGTEVYVLDVEMQPVEAGAWGELYLGGAGLARGYLHRPDRTATAFVPHPFGATPGARLYRTGDRARLRADGQLEFGGRSDRQVKLRGFRIELGEIQATLRRHPAVATAVVLRREDTPGVPRLVAYVVGEQKNKRTNEQTNKEQTNKEQQSTNSPPSPTAVGEGGWGDEGLSASSLRQWLQAQLPRYMIPSAFVFLDALPLTPNGKIDERALPEPDLRTYAAHSGALETPLERAVARIWADVLGVEPRDPNDNFFELGGHSLKATQMIARIREQFQVELPLHAILGAPTLAEIALLIEEHRADAAGVPQAAIPRAERDQPLPLSFSQERVWFLNELSPGNTAYNTQVTIRFTGPLEINVLEQAFGEIIRRHELLRTAFVAEDGQPVQIIHPPYAVSIPLIDLRDLPAERRADETSRLIDAEFQRSFDVRQIPLIRWTLLRLADQEHLLIQVEHHLIHDGWSLSVLFGEMQALYQAYLRGESSPLPELPIQFADFTTWQRQWIQDGIAADQMAYWKRQLAGSSFVLELPTDRPRPVVQTFRGATYSTHLPTELALAVRAFSRREGATLFMTLLATFQTLLYRYTGQDDLIVGSGIANRRWHETETLIGMIINNLMLRARLGANLTFRELLAQVRNVTLEAYAHQDLPFDKLVEELHPPRDLSRNPIFQVMFSFHDAAMPDLDFPDLIADLHYAHNRSAKFDLNVIVIPLAEQRIGRERRANDDDIMIEWEYNTDLFDESTIVRLVEHYQTLLRAIVADPAARLAELPLLTEHEQRRLLVEWNAPTGELPAVCVHEVIAQQAARTPEAIAVVCGADELSYHEL